MEPRPGEDRRYRLVGELDLATVPILTDTLSPATAGDGNLELDLADLTFVDSSGIRGLLLLAEGMGSRGHLVLAEPNEAVLRTLRLVGIEQAANIEISTSAG